MNAALKEALRNCVKEALEAQSRSSTDILFGPFPEKTWELGPDGDFRPRAQIRYLIPIETALEGCPSFSRCYELAQSDPIIGPQLDQFVGTSLCQFKLDMAFIVRSLVRSTLSQDGQPCFDEDRFDGACSRIMIDLESKTYRQVVYVAPLPNLSAPFPIGLTGSISIDRLTAEEVNSCVQIGVLRPDHDTSQVIRKNQAVGIRVAGILEKIVGHGAAEIQLGGSGKFGDRFLTNVTGTADDVISALRLYKSGRVRSAGVASFTTGWPQSAITHVHFGTMRPLEGCDYELNSPDIDGLRNLWHTLTSGILEKRPFVAAGLRRFNMAFDRRNSEDAIVDLMIAAESLFLGDGSDTSGRGEQRFRLSLRAAKFVQSDLYEARRVYAIMRKAYDLRSQVVHGGRIKKSELPDNPNATFSEFTSAVEEIVRLGIKRALVEDRIGEKRYWDDLLFDENEDER